MTAELSQTIGGTHTPLTGYGRVPQFRVLIVEDDFLIALDLQQTLTGAGWDVCGVATSQADALHIAETLRPGYAVVDVRLSPGDGRVVARELTDRYATAVLLATAHCSDKTDLSGAHAIACLAKPYSPWEVVRALEIVREVRAGYHPTHLPEQMRMFA